MTGITGLDINLTVGDFRVNRLPLAELRLVRGAVAGRCILELPDPGGKIAAGLNPDDSVDLYFGYRGGLNQSWQGKITEIKSLRDTVEVTALSAELAFIKTKVTECFHQETTKGVITRLMALAGITPGRLEGPDEIIPHMIFSGQSVFQCFRQINETLERVYKFDMSARPYWVDDDGLGHWGDFDAPGPGPILASGDNLIRHDPKGDEGEAAALLCPGLGHSQLFTIRDDRRALTLTKRALSVVHRLSHQGNRTIVTYGKENGYG